MLKKKKRTTSSQKLIVNKIDNYIFIKNPFHGAYKIMKEKEEGEWRVDSVNSINWLSSIYGFGKTGLPQAKE